MVMPESQTEMATSILDSLFVDLFWVGGLGHVCISITSVIETCFILICLSSSLLLVLFHDSRLSSG